ncbi:MAG: zf-TFIIB domain-containing protein [bacterium]
MKCPVCKNEMSEQDFGGVRVDVCKNACKGIWFDWLELKKLDEKNEGFGNALMEAQKYPRINDEDRKKINCPKCGLPMHMHKYKSAKEINVDECYECGGFFLDSGEFKEIRDKFMSEKEEEEYLQKLIDGIPARREAMEEQQKEKLRADALRKYTRFMRLSYYLTGK